MQRVNTAADGVERCEEMRKDMKKMKKMTKKIRKRHTLFTDDNGGLLFFLCRIWELSKISPRGLKYNTATR